MTTRTAGPLAAVLMLLAVLAAGCAPPPRDPNHLVVWTLENLPERLAAIRSVTERFTQATGITVEMVGVDENQFTELVTASAASGVLPDVVGSLPLAAVRSLAANELLDPAATGQALTALGPETFSARALELTREGNAQLAVPSEAWPQLLLYRRDLFAAAGLPEPRTYADVTAAATRLNTDDVAGFVGATIAGDAFTQQTFEHLALANGCEMVDEGGRVALDSPACVAAFAFYDDLIRNHSVAGAQDVDTTRATYFAGKAAMTIWSSFILDELAGLRDDAAPSCPQCAADPRFLVDNTGIVTALTGPDGARARPVRRGAVVGGAGRRERRPGGAVHRIHDVRRLPRCPGVGAGGQIPDAVGHAGGAHASSWTRGGRCRRVSTGACRWTSCTRRRCSTPWPAASTRSAGGGSRRDRGRWWGRRWASCRCRRRSRR